MGKIYRIATDLDLLRSSYFLSDVLVFFPPGICTCSNKLNMLLAILNISVIQIVWILLSVIIFVSIFLTTVYSDQKDELQKSIFPSAKQRENHMSPEFFLFCFQRQESIFENLNKITKKLTEKKQMLKESQSQIKNVEETLNEMTNKTIHCHDRYKSLMFDLKKDVYRTEEEVKTLQLQVMSLNAQRESLKNEVKKQQEICRKELLHFTKELERNVW
ncbi:uncharacterized protein PF3D7_1120000-like [Prorops nasuta]|uniref:uncharacterized protein PF3D7_1120000-like n=1 Tax=Prorops nasuta TaxID=863751 RepID=UPI0034CD9EB7